MALDLRPTADSELDFVLELEADPDVSPFISPATRERHAEAISDPDQEHLLVTDDGEPVGFALLAGIENPHRSLEVRRIGVVTRGKGVGRRALALIVDRAFERWSPRRVWLDVIDHNERAQRAYEAAGFVREGVLRESLRIGDRYESMVIMSVLMSEWEERRGAADPQRVELIRRTYDAFNARRVEEVLEAMADDVDWPNVFGSRRVRGHTQMRAYWRDQFAQIDPRVTPLGFSTRDDGRIEVRVNQVVNDLNGDLIGQDEVLHVYEFNDDGLVARMDIEGWADR